MIPHRFPFPLLDRKKKKRSKIASKFDNGSTYYAYSRRFLRHFSDFELLSKILPIYFLLSFHFMLPYRNKWSRSVTYHRKSQTGKG